MLTSAVHTAGGVQMELRRTGGMVKNKSFKEKVKQNVAHNFDQSIQIYQAFEERHGFFREFTLKLADAVEMRAFSSVLDVGCGYGISAKAIHSHLHCKVLGIDLSPKMIAAGRVLCNEPDIRLCEGDGEKLSSIVGEETFDYVLYNASIFIFPDVFKTIAESSSCLKKGGKIAFSFYPQLLGQEDEDLFDLAFQRLGKPLPKFRVITNYSKACDALMQCATDIQHHRWSRPFRVEFLKDFFSIPAQSASLFPGCGYEERRDLVIRLFDTLGDMEEKGRVVWRMAEGTKS